MTVVDGSPCPIVRPIRCPNGPTRQFPRATRLVSSTRTGAQWRYEPLVRWRRRARPSSPQQIRNVVLVGPPGAGKSTLFEHLVAARVEGRRPRDDDRASSTGLVAASFASGEVVVNLIDTPGNPDFVGEVRAGLRAADAALFVVSGADGVDEATRMLWRECERPVCRVPSP